MKKKVLIMIMTLVVALSVAGCGKKKTVGDNLINADPTAYSSGETVNLSSQEESDQDSEIKNLSENPEEGDLGEDSEENADNSEEDNSEEETPDEENPDSENLNETEEGNTEEQKEEADDETDEETSEKSEENSSETAEEKADEVIEESNSNEGISEIKNNTMVFSNVCGQDISKLYLTFNVGYVNNLEILGTEELLNGFCFKYAITDTGTLKDAGIVTLNVKGVTRKGEELDFGSLEIIDLSDISIVLGRNSNGYFMYLG